MKNIHRYFGYFFEIHIYNKKTINFIYYYFIIECYIWKNLILELIILIVLIIYTSQCTFPDINQMCSMNFKSGLESEFLWLILNTLMYSSTLYIIIIHNIKNIKDRFKILHVCLEVLRLIFIKILYWYFMKRKIS